MVVEVLEKKSSGSSVSRTPTATYYCYRPSKTSGSCMRRSCSALCSSTPRCSLKSCRCGRRNCRHATTSPSPRTAPPSL